MIFREAFVARTHYSLPEGVVAGRLSCRAAAVTSTMILILKYTRGVGVPACPSTDASFNCNSLSFRSVLCEKAWYISVV